MNEKSESPLTEPELFARRMQNIPRSFIREMLKTSTISGSISFAGGLPDENLIPTDALNKAFNSALAKHGSSVFQYANSEGFLPLREWISGRYRDTVDLEINPENILLTNGSQQAFDLIGKVFLEKNDKVAIEQPGYLGVIQSLLCFEPELLGIPIEEDGMDISQLKDKLSNNDVKLMHLVPNFQNPSGIQYSEKKRNAICDILSHHKTILVEDDPYGELFFGEKKYLTPFKKQLGDQSILLGSFSKTLSPGMRLGWIVASDQIIEKLLIAKQASDLHTNNISQMMAYEFLISNNYEAHLSNIRTVYSQRRNQMLEAIKQHLPEEIAMIAPNGGMFFWLKLPKEISSMELVETCMKKGVVFVPGSVFHIDGTGDHSLRLNYSKSTEDEIQRGIEIIGNVIKEKQMKGVIQYS